MAANDEPTGPEGRAAIEAVARSATADARTRASALAFFMGDEPPPGSTQADHFPLQVDFGTADAPNFQRVMFRPLDNEELVACEVASTVRTDAGVVERIDPFTRWSYVYAYACVEPNLGEVLRARMDREGVDPHTGVSWGINPKTKKPWTDAADLVRHVFRKQPGVLQHAAHAIESRTRLGTDRDSAVREVEAGKG